jgi:ankyrin repeat protein
MDTVDSSSALAELSFQEDAQPSSSSVFPQDRIHRFLALPLDELARAIHDGNLNVNLIGFADNSLIEYAVLSKNDPLKTLQLLDSAGADWIGEHHRAWAMIFRASGLDNSEILEWILNRLLESGKSYQDIAELVNRLGLKHLGPDDRSIYSTSIYHACKLGKLHNVKVLERWGAKFGSIRHSPFCAALFSGNVELVTYLLTLPISTHSFTRDIDFVLTPIIEGGSIEVFKMMEVACSTIGVPLNYPSLVSRCAGKNQVALMEYCVIVAPEPIFPWPFVCVAAENPLKVAALQGCFEAFIWLFDHGCHNPTSVDMILNTVLRTNNQAMIRYCLENGPPIWVPNATVTPLHVAISHHNKDFVKYCLVNGAKLAMSKPWQDPIWTALSKDADLDILRLLVDAMALVQMPLTTRASKDGCDALAWAITSKAPLKVLRFLLTEQGFSAHFTLVGAWNPLYYACKSERLDVVKMLIEEYRVNPNCTPSGKPTNFSLLGLLHGSRTINWEIVQYLGTHGCDFDLADPNLELFKFLREEDCNRLLWFYQSRICNRHSPDGW